MCPDCGAPMVVLELEGIEIDYCADCGGTWLDTGELEQILELGDVPAGRLAALIEPEDAGRRGKRRCPRCRRRLAQVTIGDSGTAAAVEVDRCRLGHGLWLDAGELRALVRLLAGSEEGAVAQFFLDALGHELSKDVRGG